MKINVLYRLDIMVFQKDVMMMNILGIVMVVY